ncbi:beta-ketoacyl-ACP reductase [Pseudozobellia thermophila]|uniref:3-oxoacyl-[acyl-carrier-protein] reductase FabG n=1 Tax=Pseudozobellia thermophila TaxID=192903 RepID=A0A1M6C9F7_9FLAO|nr:beta-ketoacyl-ACP reductase [Pseudozobellia thermophila]SHI57394.1 3-oxoacyl-[acyl-carrier-protein] reductase [Pseudozobellia thermophila]
MNRLKDKVAVVTGGANGIGKITVEKFLQEGAKVICWDINKEAGEKLMEQNKGKSLEFQQVNTVNRSEVDQAVAYIIKTYGCIDILINNAGITRDATLRKMTQEQWQSVLDVNLTGVFNCTQAISEHMVEKGSGKIVSASSVVGLYGNFGQSNYVATKSGVIGLTKVWARELGRKGINVNAVAPGFIATEMVETIPEKVIKDLETKTPLGRLGKPEDIANAYVFLSSEEASFINGTTLSVDGGLVM